MASYGQLVGQPSYSDDSALFDRQAGAGESSRAASSSSSSSTPALKITVTDPLKKVDQHRTLLLFQLLSTAHAQCTFYWSLAPSHHSLLAAHLLPCCRCSEVIAIGLSMTHCCDCSAMQHQCELGNAASENPSSEPRLFCAG